MTSSTSLSLVCLTQKPEVESSKMIDKLRLGSGSIFKFDATAVCWLGELRILDCKKRCLRRRGFVLCGNVKMVMYEKWWRAEERG